MQKAVSLTEADPHIEIVEVDNRNRWRQFHDLPHKIYKDDPNWVAPLRLERQILFNTSHNPFFQHAKAAFFLALRDGIPVGRITAQIDDLHLARYNDATGHFGFIEAIDDPKVFDALLQAAETWLKSSGMRRSVGPVSFSMWGEPGLLVEGFDRPPSVLMGHARPYYEPRIVERGYTKAQDLLAYDYENHLPLPPTMQKILARAQEKHQFKFRPIRMGRKDFPSEVATMLEILNDAWSDNWGFVPMTKAELDDTASTLKLLIPAEAIVMAEYQGEAAAFAVTIPNLNEAIRDLNGRLLPLGFLKLIWRLKVAGTKSGRMALMGVRKKWQNSPVGAVLAMSVIQQTRTGKFGDTIDIGELSWIVDSNERMKHMLSLVGGKIYKRYRIYEKAIG